MFRKFTIVATIVASGTASVIVYISIVPIDSILVKITALVGIWMFGAVTAGILWFRE